MKTKRTVIAVLAAILLISAALIISCMDQLDIISAKQNVEEEITYKIPPGKAVVRFKISDSNARTILPTVTPLSSMTYDVVFSDAVNGAGNIELALPNDGIDLDILDGAKLSYSEITDIIPIASGDYFIKLTAYDVTGTVPIARYVSAAKIDLTAGNTVQVPAVLVGIVDGTDTGTFSLAYNVNTGYDSATITILNKDGSALSSPINNVALLTTSSAQTYTKDLDSGYYIVKFSATGAKVLSKEITEVLHIYPAMTSTHTIINASTSPTVNRFDVAFAGNFGTNNSNTAANYFTTGDGKSQLTYYGHYATEPDTDPSVSNANTVFKGWFTSANPIVNDAPYAFTTTRVTADLNLYAKWAVESGFNISLSADELMTNPDVSYPVNGSSLVIGSYDGFNTVVIVLDPPSPYTDWDTGSITWEVNGVLFTAHNDDTLILTNSGSPGDFLFDNNLLSPGTIEVSVRATVTTIPYSKSVSFDITAN